MTFWSKKITQPDLPEVEAFFEQQINKLALKKFFPKEDVQFYLAWHTFSELLEKIIDPNRFLRIIRDKEERIIGFFESKTHSQENNTHVVQWTLIDEKYRRSGIGSIFAHEFQEYCQSKWIEKIITFIHKDNKPSLAFRENLWFIRIEEEVESGIITLEKRL